MSMKGFDFTSVGDTLQLFKLLGQEGVFFEMREKSPELVLCFYDPTDKEIQEIKKGQIKMGYFVYGSVIFIVVKFGEMPWMDAPFSIRKYDGYPGFMPCAQTEVLLRLNDNNNMGAAITIKLVDIKSGVVKVIRVIGASNRFSRGFYKEVNRQYELPYSEMEYNLRIKNIYSRFSSKDLARNAENVFCLKSKTM